MRRGRKTKLGGVICLWRMGIYTLGTLKEKIGFWWLTYREETLWKKVMEADSD